MFGRLQCTEIFYNEKIFELFCYITIIFFFQITFKHWDKKVLVILHFFVIIMFSPVYSRMPLSVLCEWRRLGARCAYLCAPGLKILKTWPEFKDQHQWTDVSDFGVDSFTLQIWPGGTHTVSSTASAHPVEAFQCWSCLFVVKVNATVAYWCQKRHLKPPSTTGNALRS